MLNGCFIWVIFHLFFYVRKPHVHPTASLPWGIMLIPDVNVDVDVANFIYQVFATDITHALAQMHTCWRSSNFLVIPMLPSCEFGTTTNVQDFIFDTFKNLIKMTHGTLWSLKTSTSTSFKSESPPPILVSPGCPVFNPGPPHILSISYYCTASPPNEEQISETTRQKSTGGVFGEGRETWAWEAHLNQPHTSVWLEWKILFMEEEIRTSQTGPFARICTQAPPTQRKARQPGAAAISVQSRFHNQSHSPSRTLHRSCLSTPDVPHVKPHRA